MHHRRPRSRTGLRTGVFAFAAVALPGVPVLAQETGDATPPVPRVAATVEGAKTYTPADFARFAPRNAADMLRQVPGFIIQRPDERRGLGEAGGNVLINGRRISGKSNDALTELGRIPARSVQRIEIVDGATLNVPGLSGQVANVIATLGGSSGQFVWRPEIRARNADPLLLRGEASLSGTMGPIGYTIGLRNEAFRGGGAGPGLILGPDGTLLETRDELIRVRGDRAKLSSSFKYEAPGGSIGNLNLSYGRFWFQNREVSERSARPQVDRVRRVRTTEQDYSYEIGGDYELALGGGRLKLIGLHQFEHSPVVSAAITSFADSAPNAGSRFTRTGDESETIARAEYRWRSGGSDWQVSAEGAFNSLDNLSGLFTLLSDGTFREVPLPGGSARVEEDRAEVRATWGRPLSPALSVQASLGAEYSKLSLIGEAGSARSFYRPKGFVSAAWKVSPRLDLNAKLERKVGQLNFGDFLATENLQNDNRNVGNPELVPPQSWELDLSGSRNLGRYGSTTLRLFGHFFTDVVDQIPIGEFGESPGNLDSATVYGLESRTTFLFDPLGWRGAKLDARFNFQNSSLEDPLTGEMRRISGSPVRQVDVSLRHDIPRTDWAWGGQAMHNRQARSFRLGEISLSQEGPVFGNVYVENKDVRGLTVRAALGNIFGGGNRFERVVYTGRRTGPIAFIEQRQRFGGPIFSLSISGTI
ncbi:MAG: TonB-dependent receptor plug domain-containing protein [Pseudomonadota bacterium]|nr:TonB-dependent receptor plug domain-containing protein [Pseudomonadota bacterium]